MCFGTGSAGETVPFFSGALSSRLEQSVSSEVMWRKISLFFSQFEEFSKSPSCIDSLKVRVSSVREIRRLTTEGRLSKL